MVSGLNLFSYRFLQRMPKYGNKRDKEVRAYFDSGGAGQNLQKCRMCPWSSTDNVTRLREHLKKKHPEVEEQVSAEVTLHQWLDRSVTADEQSTAERALAML